MTALLPSINMMNVVGIVSIPGMMTGQLLGGASPLIAAKYQMTILWLLLTTRSISTYVAIHLVIRNALFDSSSRLTSEKVLRRAKLNIDVAFYNVIKTYILSRIPKINLLSRNEIELSSSNGNNIMKTSLLPNRYNINHSYDKISSSMYELDDDVEDFYEDVNLDNIIIGKTKYNFIDNLSHLDRFFNPDNIIFQVTNLNVMSGKLPLFSTKGTDLKYLSIYLSIYL
jgi:hypothetical protein